MIPAPTKGGESDDTGGGGEGRDKLCGGLGSAFVDDDFIF
jgi:hypothetical protein